VNSQRADQIAYRWVMDKCKVDNNHIRINRLELIGQPPYDNKYWAVFRQLLMQLGAYAYRSKTGKSMGPQATTLPIFVSPDYSLRDIYKLFLGMRFSYKGNMINDPSSVAFNQNLPEISIPIFFFQGKHDMVIPGEILEKYFRTLTTLGGKTFFYLENSAHFYCMADEVALEQHIGNIKDTLYYSVPLNEELLDENY
jgi:pimeloyl-ACP methyl ester carboxylesterase